MDSTHGNTLCIAVFPDDYATFHTFSNRKWTRNSDKWIRKWYSDYLDLEYDKNSNYGRAKCFHCPSPDRDDQIFIEINRLITEWLESKKSNT